MKIKQLHLILEDQTNMKTTSLVEQLLETKSYSQSQ